MLTANTYMFENVKGRYFPDSHKLPSLSVKQTCSFKERNLLYITNICTANSIQGPAWKYVWWNYKYLIFNHVFCFKKIDVTALHWIKIKKILKIWQLKM